MKRGNTKQQTDTQTEQYLCYKVFFSITVNFVSNNETTLSSKNIIEETDETLIKFDQVVLSVLIIG